MNYPLILINNLGDPVATFDVEANSREEAYKKAIDSYKLMVEKTFSVIIKEENNKI